MNLKRLVAPVAVAAVALLAPAVSHAGLMIQITDGTTTLNVADGDVLDGVSESGTVGFNGSIGGWTVTAAFGTSAADPLAMHLSAVVVGDRTDGKVWIKFTHTGLDAVSDPMPFAAFGGGAGAYGSQASWAAYVDDGNQAFGTGQLVHSSNGYTTTGGSTSAALTGTYSASIVSYFDYSGIGNFFPQGSSLDINLIPEPTSLALLGLGLVGMGAVRRRKA